MLALLYFTLHDGFRAWKGYDWDALGRLHDKGMICDLFSDRRLGPLELLFAKGGPNVPATARVVALLPRRLRAQMGWCGRPTSSRRQPRSRPSVAPHR